MTTAQTRGNIRSLLGRLGRFDKWEPVPERSEKGQKVRALKLLEAEAKWPRRRLQRAGVHKSLNRIIQSSAADQTKEAMRQLYYEHGIVPQLTVHDELAGSICDMEEARTYKCTMENCVELLIPTVCDVTLGSDWGHAKEEVEL
jgi:DNA polymerase I-like protein with 3'-5' exonuclease and polymerase domains